MISGDTGAQECFHQSLHYLPFSCVDTGLVDTQHLWESQEDLTEGKCLSHTVQDWLFALLPCAQSSKQLLKKATK